MINIIYLIASVFVIRLTLLFIEGFKLIQKTINRIVKDKNILRKHPNINLELDEIELKKYLDK